MKIKIPQKIFTKKKIFQFLVGATTSVFFLYVVSDKIDLEAIKKLLSIIPGNSIFLALVVFLVSQVVKALRWELILQKNNRIKLRSKNALIFLLMNPLNIALPFRIGDFVRVVMSTGGLGATGKLMALVFEKLLDLSAITALFLTFFLIEKYTSGDHFYAFGTISIIFLVGFSILVFWAIKPLIQGTPSLRQVTYFFGPKKLLVVIIFTYVGYILDAIVIQIICSEVVNLMFVKSVQINSVVGLTSVIPSLPFGIGVFHFFIGEYLNFLDLDLDGFSMSAVLNLFFIIAYFLQFGLTSMLFVLGGLVLKDRRGKGRSSNDNF